jgi:NifU-like protein involved in Fe-S cluster formation
MNRDSQEILLSHYNTPSGQVNIQSPTFSLNAINTTCNDFFKLYGLIVRQQDDTTASLKIQSSKEDGEQNNASQADLEFIVQSDVLTSLSFSGNGCFISKASTSILCKLCTGKDISIIMKIIEGLFVIISDRIYHTEMLEVSNKSVDTRRMLLLSTLQGQLGNDEFQELFAFHEYYKFPVKLSCITFSWHTLFDFLSKSLKSNF